MLGLITQWVPNYLANDIIKQSTSIDSICQFIRKYYGFQKEGEHNDRNPTKDEDISPTIERLAILRWMELIHPSLPALVQHTFAYDLQHMTERFATTNC